MTVTTDEILIRHDRIVRSILAASPCVAHGVANRRFAALGEFDPILQTDECRAQPQAGIDIAHPDAAELATKAAITPNAELPSVRTFRKSITRFREKPAQITDSSCSRSSRACSGPRRSLLRNSITVTSGCCSSISSQTT